MEAKDHLKMQAQIWKQEARTQAATVHECYQLCTGAKGEPGNWHGAEPVRAVVAERDWLRNALEHIAGSCEGRAAEVARAALMGPNDRVERPEAACGRRVALERRVREHDARTTGERRWRASLKTA